jgi:hypothetical protein
MKKFLAILVYSLVFLLPVVASAVTYKCPDGKNSFNAAGTQVCTDSKNQVYGYFNTAGSYVQSSQNQSGSQPSSVSPNSGGNLTYTPLEPLPGVNLTTSGGGVDLESLINSLFKILLALGAMTAVAMLVFSGVTYMVSDVVNKKNEARKRIQNAVFGLLLLIGAYLILNTINPQLVNFVNPAPAAPNVSSIKPPSSGGGSTNSGPGTIGGSYTNYGWYIVGNTNMAVLCNQAVGPGWVTVDSNQCKAPKPSSAGTSYVYGCCGYNPKYTPPAPPAPPEDSPPLPPGESERISNWQIVYVICCFAPSSKECRMRESNKLHRG